MRHLAPFISSGLVAFILAVPSKGELAQITGGQLHVEAGAAVEYDSNVFLSEQKEHDQIGRVNVGLRFAKDKQGLLHFRSGLGVEALRYYEHRDLDTENFRSYFDLSYPNGVQRNAQYDVRGHYNHVSQARSDAGAVLDFQQAAVSGSYRINLNEKSAVAAIGSLDRESFDDPLYSDSSDFSGELDYVHRASKLNLRSGYRYHVLEYSSPYATQQSGHTLLVGADGALLAKVSGRLLAGAQYCELHSPLNTQRQVQPFYEIELRWAAGKKTTVSLSGKADFKSTPLGEMNNVTDLNLGLAVSPNSRSGASINLLIGQEKVEGLFARKDTAATLSTHYFRTIGQTSKVELRAQFQERRSKLTRFDQDRLIVGMNFATTY